MEAIVCIWCGRSLRSYQGSWLSKGTEFCEFCAERQLDRSLENPSFVQYLESRAEQYPDGDWPLGPIGCSIDDGHESCSCQEHTSDDIDHAGCDYCNTDAPLQANA